MKHEELPGHRLRAGETVRVDIRHTVQTRRQHKWALYQTYRKYTRLQTVWSLPGPSRQANKGHSPRCHRRPNGPGRLADKVVQPTTQCALCRGVYKGDDETMLNESHFPQVPICTKDPVVALP